MSEVRDLSAADIADIFGSSTQPNTNTTPTFGGGIDNPADLFGGSKPEPPKEDKVIEEPQQIDNQEPDVPKVDGEEKSADIFDDSKAPKEGDKVVEIKGLADYYKDRLEKGQFVGIEAEDDKGNKTQFVPQTPEEFDEVIQIQVDYKLEQAKKDLEKNWYDAKSPAWKAVSQYAEMVDDPSQLIPFLQGVRNIQTVSNLNEEDSEQAEMIVRARMEQRGDPDTIIKSQIDALKSTDSLISTAKQVKPLMLQEEQRALSQQVQQARIREQEYLQDIHDIREKALKAIEQPLFGKTKLKQEEKAIIYDLIALPSEQTQGYGIYSEIDKLFETRDFETLKMLALFVSKKDAFYQYLGTDIANQTATKLQKKLTVAGEMRGSGKDFNTEERPVVQRNQFNKTPRFGK